MDWTQILFLFFGNAALITWFRAESRADWRHIDSKTDAIRNDMQIFQKEMQYEMKDFHARLISLEERYRR